jgi:hypothetical protein
VIDIREILRRLHLGEPDRRIARDLGVRRNTVAHYRVWATRHGVLSGGQLPDPATLAVLLERAPPEQPAHEQSLVEPLRERVLALRERGVEGQAIWQLLVEEHSFTGSYSSVKRSSAASPRRWPGPPSDSKSSRGRRRTSTSASPASSLIPNGE